MKKHTSVSQKIGSYIHVILSLDFSPLKENK